MAGKHPRNPLLSNASLNFPFDNYASSALLVPVPQSESALIPEVSESEVENFLGQEQQRRGSSGLKPFPSPGINKSSSSQSLASEPSFFSSIRSHFTSEPQLSASRQTPIPEFTQSFTGASNTAKPTPVYADAVNNVPPPPSASYTYVPGLTPASNQNHSNFFNNSSSGLNLTPDCSTANQLSPSDPSIFIPNFQQKPTVSNLVPNEISLNNPSSFFDCGVNTPVFSPYQGQGYSSPSSILTPAPTPVSSNSPTSQVPYDPTRATPLQAVFSYFSSPNTSNSSTQVPSSSSLSTSVSSLSDATSTSNPTDSTLNSTLSSVPLFTLPLNNPQFSSAVFPPNSLSSSSLPTTSLPPTSLPPTTFPPPSLSPNSLPPNSLPPTSLPVTSLPQTSFSPTSFPPTSLPPPPSFLPTSLPPISFPPISLPLTSLTPTLPSPATLSTNSIPPTSLPPTSLPPTSLPPTSLPPTSLPPTSLPPTALPPTSLPPNSLPPTSSSPASLPLTSVSLTSLPLTSHTPTSLPPVSFPSASLFPTSLPPVSLPPTSIPLNSFPTQKPPEAVNPPNLSGTQANSYRLSNIKRPTYTRPPELSVTPMATVPSHAPAPVAASALVPPTPPTALFTPCAGLEDPHPPPPTSSPPVVPPSFANLAQGNSYRPVYHHWFFKKLVEGKALWQPFSMHDSFALEDAFTSATISPDTKVATDGGRYDVEVLRRRRKAVYWQEDPGEVRRCSWFVKGSMDIRYMPYEENIATMLEEEYRIASTTNNWNRQVTLPDGELIVIHSQNAIAHHTRSVSPDVWGNSPQMQQKPRVVKRGLDEFDISDGEPETVDHVLFLVHGIGKFCDLRFRPVTEVVDDFRSVTLQLLQAHFKEAVESGQAGRVEVLPISWHDALHSANIDQCLHNITLKSIPKLRHFTNDTILDVLFYTSPVFCETITQAVGNDLNRLYNLFLSRNPTFKGGVSLGGHSLGSLILFDMLCNQVPSPSPTTANSPITPPTEREEETTEEEVGSLGCLKTHKARLSRTVSYLTIGKAGTGQPFISYPQLVFRPKAFFALGSPIGMFVTVRGIESLGEDFALPTCPMFFNIFHPFDPVAYRVEALINSDFAKYSPILIPHHKGRKRMHLELKDTLEHVGTALKQRLMESVKSTWNTVYQTMFFNRTDDHAIEQEVNKVIEKGILQSCEGDEGRSETPDSSPSPDIKMGQLNEGRRIDYVLQEAPFESFNEYLFALSSHVCYWESEDTMLLMLKEIYGTMGITPDSQVVQQILPVDMMDSPAPTPQYIGLPSLPQAAGMDPTAPPSDNVPVGPPPTGGFVRH